MRARLIHPVPVTVVQTTGGTVDPDFRETVGPATTATITLQGQVREVAPDRRAQTAGGASSLAGAVGHVTFETAALATAGVTLHRGDRFVGFGARTVAYRVVAVRDAGEYGGVYSLCMAYYGPET